MELIKNTEKGGKKGKGANRGVGGRGGVGGGGVVRGGGGGRLPSRCLNMQNKS